MESAKQQPTTKALVDEIRALDLSTRKPTAPKAARMRELVLALCHRAIAVESELADELRDRATGPDDPILQRIDPCALSAVELAAATTADLSPIDKTMTVLAVVRQKGFVVSVAPGMRMKEDDEVEVETKIFADGTITQKIVSHMPREISDPDAYVDDEPSGGPT